MHSRFRNMLDERILLSRDGGGLRPYETRQPALFIFIIIMRGANLMQGVPLNDKSERWRFQFLSS